MKLTRHEFLATLGAVAGGSLDALAQASSAGSIGRDAEAAAAPTEPEGMLSFAQSGEDLIANFIFHYLRIPG